LQQKLENSAFRLYDLWPLTRASLLIFPETDKKQLFDVSVLQHCTAISAKSELLLDDGVRLFRQWFAD